jgi:hypothetical protein
VLVACLWGEHAKPIPKRGSTVGSGWPPPRESMTNSTSLSFTATLGPSKVRQPWTKTPQRLFRTSATSTFTSPTTTTTSKMLSSVRQSLARSGASPAVRVASRRTALPRARLQRGYATSVSEAQAAVKASDGGAGGSHLAAGVAGGLAVLLGGYATYRFSGLHSYVQTAQQTSTYISDARDRVSQSVSATLEKTGGAADALRYLRSVAKSYAGIIPGAGTYIESVRYYSISQTFSHVSQLHVRRI